MKKVYKIDNGQNIFKFLKKSYDETVTLLINSRDYFNTRGRIDKLNLSKEDSIAYTLAMSTITTQLTSALSWLLMCRAVQEGELSLEDIKSDDFKMPVFEPQIDDSDSIFSTLNDNVKTMLVQSSNVYNRIKRMENNIRKTLIEEVSA